MVEITAVCTYSIDNDCSCIVMLSGLRCENDYEIKQCDDNFVRKTLRERRREIDVVRNSL